MPLIDQWQGFTGLPDFSDPPAIPTDLKAQFDFLASRAIPRYASEAARDAELTSPSDGQVCTVAGVAQIYRSGWQRIVDGDPPQSGQVVTDPIPADSSNWTDIAEVTFATPFTSFPAVTLTNATSYGGADPVLLVAYLADTTGFTLRAKCASSKSAQAINWLASARTQ